MLYAKLKLRKLEGKLADFSNPFLNSLQSCKARDFIIAAALFLVAFAGYASVCTKALSNGDAAVYVQQMKNLNLGARSIHIGYYLLGAGFIRILPGSDDYAVNLMNCFLGALTVALVYFITLIICHKRLAALFSGLFLLTHYIFLENSIYAEVYTPQICFLVLALLLWLLDRPIIAGLSFALSLLITPSTIFALPLFFILRPRLRPLLLFCAVILAIAVAAILPVYRDYFFGGRGLLKATNVSVDIGRALRKEGGEVFSSLFFCIPFVVAGLLELFGRKRFRPLGIALLALWIVNLRFGEKFADVPVQLPTYVLLCLVGGLGVHLLLRVLKGRPYATILSAALLSVLMVIAILIKTTGTLAEVSRLLPKWFLITSVLCAVSCMLVAMLPVLRRIRAQIILVGAVVFAVSINGFVAFSKIAQLNKYHNGYRNSVIEVSNVTGPNYFLIGHWSQYILFEHYLFQESYTPYCDRINIRGLRRPAGGQKQSEAHKKLNEAIAARRQILLLGYYSGLFPALQRFGYKVTRVGYIYLATPLR